MTNNNIEPVHLGIMFYDIEGNQVYSKPFNIITFGVNGESEEDFVYRMMSYAIGSIVDAKSLGLYLNCKWWREEVLFLRMQVNDMTYELWYRTPYGYPLFEWGRTVRYRTNSCDWHNTPELAQLLTAFSDKVNREREAVQAAGGDPDAWVKKPIPEVEQFDNNKYSGKLFTDETRFDDVRVYEPNGNIRTIRRPLHV